MNSRRNEEGNMNGVEEIEITFSRKYTPYSISTAVRIGRSTLCEGNRRLAHSLAENGTNGLVYENGID